MADVTKCRATLDLIMYKAKKVPIILTSLVERMG